MKPLKIDQGINIAVASNADKIYVHCYCKDKRGIIAEVFRDLSWDDINSEEEVIEYLKKIAKNFSDVCMEDMSRDEW